MTDKDRDKPEYTKSTAAQDLEARRDPSYVPPGVLITNLDENKKTLNEVTDMCLPDVHPDDLEHPYAVEGNDMSAYRGVSQEYRTYANETEKPLNNEDDQAPPPPEGETLVGRLAEKAANKPSTGLVGGVEQPAAPNAESKKDTDPKPEPVKATPAKATAPSTKRS